MSGMKAVDTMPSVMLLYARLYFESVKFDILTVLATEKNSAYQSSNITVL